MKLIRSIRSLTRNDRTDSVLIPVYGQRNGKLKQVISQTVIEVRDLAKALDYSWNLCHGYAMTVKFENTDEKNAIKIKIEVDYQKVLDLIQQPENCSVFKNLVKEMLKKQRIELKKKWGKISIEEFRQKRQQIDKEFAMIK